MKVVMPCAGTKNPRAGNLMSADGHQVHFVARPDLARDRLGPTTFWARPDDQSDRGETWRQLLEEYNQAPGNNELGLLPAWQLYSPPVYGELEKAFGLADLYILSAGWGLLPATYLTPDYDITFSSGPNVPTYKRRIYAKGGYHDFRKLPQRTSDDILFFGISSYIPQFCDLSQDVLGRRVIFFATDDQPVAPGCESIRSLRRGTNWQYACAREVIGVWQAFTDTRTGDEPSVDDILDGLRVRGAVE